MNHSSRSILPTRVIDVGINGTPEIIHLVDTSAENLQGHYTALSYCWGRRPNLILTSENIENFLSRIQVASLPKTLRGAIDSICIIQDSKEDWRREASKMSQVYTNSCLTIASLIPDHNDGGCFALRNPLVYRPCMLFDQAEGATIFHRSPLHKRAWVLQESVLSSQTFYFGDILVWECGQRVVSDVTFHRGETDLYRRDALEAFL
ncbi:hypothetical protein B0J14DRAFT_546444 [Halenospora varia]|nr:hypothetical protein B0J14DRAFT_546444 [Halenospora varia]